MKTARKSSNHGYISIRSRLIAAVAMLLVASFMVVSSSYAWFTLSTAPEITGIDTAVGANGNLEIALYTGEAVAESGIGDTNQNVKWGNLIDLGDDTYGLKTISLYPARLNVTGDATNGWSIEYEKPLMTPVYSADGRISALNDGTLTGPYDGKSFDSSKTSNGVRGIGNATSMSQQQLDFRTAQIAAARGGSDAKSYATTALSNAGSTLAGMAATHAGAGETDNNLYNLTDIGVMLSTLGDAVNGLDTAALNFIRATVASKNGTATDEAYNTERDTYFATSVDDATLEGWVNDTTSVYKFGENTTLQALWDVREKVNNAVVAAKAKFDALDASTLAEDGTRTPDENAKDGIVTDAKWADVTSVLGGLVDMNTILVENYKTTELKANIEALISAVTSGKGITVTLMPADTTASNYNAETGDGVYCELAKVTGNFNVPIMIEEITYGSIPLKNIKATMKTEVENAPTIKLVDNFPTPPASSSSTANIINDLYGYVIDLAFRTNAKDSKLMLQTAEENRIYSGNTAEDTMGGGSTMTFNTSEGFGAAAVKELMNSIRLVFVDSTKKIVAVGGANTANVDLEAATVAGKVTADIQLYNSSTYEFTADGFKAIGELSFVTPDTEDGNSELMPLAQNQQVQLSVYVYLDGDSVTNADVAATTMTSMAGSLNLQFSSSAELVPMDYSPLKSTSTGSTTSGEGGE